MYCYKMSITHLRNMFLNVIFDAIRNLIVLARISGSYNPNGSGVSQSFKIKNLE